MTTQELDKGPGLDALPGERRGSIQLVLLVAIGLIGAASALMFLGRSQAEPYVLALLAVLGMVGVFSLFAAAAGILRVAGRSEGNPAFKRVLDDAVEGIAVTDESGRVVYANAAYCRLVDADDLNDVRPVERVFIGDPDVSEAVYRLLKAAREGRRLQEEVRVSAVPGQPGALAPTARPPARHGGTPKPITPYGPSPTSRASESGRRTFSRSCSTRSTISTMRRPASSRSMDRGTSATSTPRSPAGSTTISPKSAPAA